MDIPTSAALPEMKRGVCTQHKTCANGKQRLARHASFNTSQPSEGIKRKVSSEPSSPHRERPGNYQGDLLFLTPLNFPVAVT